MSTIRHRLASAAVSLVALQIALLFAVPVSACCQGIFRLKAEAAGGRAEATKEIECCPPGSHPPGQCPLHRSKNSKTECRITCGAPQSAQILLGGIGIIQPPQSVQIDLTMFALDAGAPFPATARPSLPDAPPPRLL